ncbi:hypothetical protein [Arenicella xantha]|uniref:JmjC domain-containing protein n=1 Tax=Arenicella xantha TaxID=644221 RepID=A0A395JII1_9GAMM|nr:hypothetical protein [Arenicella xantha]RBP49937.1 hypothetical protein DFR28_103369 [Arenicella xantha]
MLLPKGDLNDFWDRALHETQCLQRAALIKDQFDCQAFGETVALEVISQLCQIDDSGLKAGARVYVDGAETSQSTFSVGETPLPAESLFDWLKRRFVEQGFCTIVNYANVCSEAYTQAVAELLVPLVPQLKSLGCAYPFIEPGLFLGDYDKTPFGIHIDKAELVSVLHVHLGPGSKRMTVWPASHSEFAGKNNILHNISGHLNTGKTYLIEAGDAFFLPAGSHYHIGENQSLSLSLTIAIHNSQNNQRKAVKQMLKRHGESGENASRADLQRELQELIDHQACRRHSNRYLPRCLLSGLKSPLVLKGRIQKTAPFEISLTAAADDGQSTVYARGYKLREKASIEAHALIHDINNGQRIDVETWLNNQVDPLERVAQESLIRELLAVHAITLAPLSKAAQ